MVGGGLLRADAHFPQPFCVPLVADMFVLRVISDIHFDDVVFMQSEFYAFLAEFISVLLFRGENDFPLGIVTPWLTLLLA